MLQNAAQASMNAGHRAARKERLRQQFRRYRASLSDDEYERLSKLIVEEAKLLPEVRVARTVHVYWPILDQREIDTRPLVRWLETQEKEIVLPLVVNFEHGGGNTRRLEHARYPGESGLRVNKWGIAEPPPNENVPIDRLDAVIVPMLGAGRNGHRIGHGYGYYDEFLAAVAATKIGLVYDECLLDVVPSAPHDVRLDVLITESDVVHVT